MSTHYDGLPEPSNEPDDILQRALLEAAQTANDRIEFYENQETAVQLERYVHFGLGLIKQDEVPIAQQYFTNRTRANAYGVRLQVQRMMLMQLTTEADLIAAMRDAAQWSIQRGRQLGLVDIGPFPPYLYRPPYRDATFADYTDRYKETLVPRLEREKVVLMAEQWVYLWRELNGRPLRGIEDASADAAAYLMSEDVPLYAEYLTRTPGRMEWFKAAHPERAREVENFQRFWYPPDFGAAS